jgi:hypothetical protein
VGCGIEHPFLGSRLLESSHFGLGISDFGLKIQRRSSKTVLEFRNPHSQIRNRGAPDLQNTSQFFLAKPLKLDVGFRTWFSISEYKLMLVFVTYYLLEMH